MGAGSAWSRKSIFRGPGLEKAVPGNDKRGQGADLPPRGQFVQSPARSLVHSIFLEYGSISTRNSPAVRSAYRVL